MWATAAVAVGVVVGVLVAIAVAVAVGRRSGNVMVCVLVSGPDGVSTDACTVIVCPCRARSYFTHESASPGCATTPKLSVHGGTAPVRPGLVTDTPAIGVIRLNCTGTPLPMAAPVVPVTSALITLLSVPS